MFVCRFLDKEDVDGVPTYDEICRDRDELILDEKQLTEQENFEVKYNYRYEEPDAEFVKRYPRTFDGGDGVGGSLRRTDDRRKIKRQEVKDRKVREKAEKMDEMKKLRELKGQEIEERLNKLREITGNERMAFDTNDLDDDFDPAKHDERMKTLFDDDYYRGDGDEDDVKPEFSDMDDELEIGEVISKSPCQRAVFYLFTYFVRRLF